MADKTHIEWTDATWNIVNGCSVVSPGCTNCYAMKLAGTRLKHVASRAGLTTMSKAGPVWNGQVRFNEDVLTQPLRWKRPRKIFVCAHGDLFHESVPDEWIDKVFAVIALAPQYIFQVLTKRSARMREYMTSRKGLRIVQQRIARAIIDSITHGKVDASIIGKLGNTDLWPVVSIGGTIDDPEDISLDRWPLPNVQLGVSVEDQLRANERIPDLLATPAAVRWISAEPLLSHVNLRRIKIAPDHHTIIDALEGYLISDSISGSGAERAKLDWIVAGGESGPGARPMHPDWVRSIRDQCVTADVPFLFKQWGEWSPHTREIEGSDGIIKTTPRNNLNWHKYNGGMFRVGKKRAGRLLDGVEHNGYPEAKAQ